MEVADSGVEAEEPLADVPSDDETEELVGQVREIVRPVLFNSPILRLVKIVLGATIFTMVLNPPYALLDKKAIVNVEAHATQQPDVANPLLTGVATEAEEGAEILKEISAIIAPSAATHLVRTEKKRSGQQFAAEAVVDADAPHVVEQAGPSATDAPHETASVRIVRSNARRGSAEEVEEKSVLDVVEQLAEPKATEQTPEMVWREATVLPHVIIAALVLIGVVIHVRSRIIGLLQSIPQFVVGKIRS